GLGSAFGDVRVRYPAPLADPGTRGLLDAVLALRNAAAVDRGSNRRPGERLVSLHRSGCEPGAQILRALARGGSTRRPDGEWRRPPRADALSCSGESTASHEAATGSVAPSREAAWMNVSEQFTKKGRGTACRRRSSSGRSRT